MKKPQELQIVFRHDKKSESQTRVNEAFDILFDEVFRLMNEKPIMTTK